MSSSLANQEVFARILLVDRDVAAARAIVPGLKDALPFTVEIEVASGRAAAELLRSGSRFDIAIVELTAAAELGQNAEDGLGKLVKLAVGAITIAVSGDPSVSAALAAMRAGAHDVMSPPLDPIAVAVRISELGHRHGRGWPIAGGDPSAAEMAALLAGAGRALRATAAAGPDLPDVLPMWQQEQRIIEEAIARFAGNITLAAAALQLNPSTIYRKRQAWAEMDASKGAA